MWLSEKCKVSFRDVCDVLSGNVFKPVGRWFPPGTPVSSTRKLISSSFHRLDMTLTVAEALNPNKPKKTKNPQSTYTCINYF